MEIECHICAGRAGSMPWGGSVCCACGSISVTQLPTDDELKEFYREYNKTYSGGPRIKGARVRQRRYARLHLRTVMDFKKGGRLIDIGSSTSPFPNYAVEAGYQVTVADFVRPRDLHRDIHFIEGTLNKEGEISSHTSKRFDVVTALAVLEHCREPHVAIRELSSVCAPNGIIYVITPDIGCFAERNALGRTSWFYPPEHLHLISHRGIVLAFGQVGCELVYARKIEISHLRWFVRYGLGVAEGAMGWAIRHCNHSYWIRARETRVSFYRGIMAFMFRKPSSG